MSMINLIKKVISLIMRFGPAFGGAVGFAQKATETSKNLANVMPDFPVQKKAEEIAQNQEYAKSLVQLAAIESAYNTARGILHVAIYGILTWGLCKLLQGMMAIGNHKKRIGSLYRWVISQTCNCI